MSKIIGIDLGTTNSCVSVMEGNEPVVIPNSEGKRTTPSIVAFLDEGKGERKVGDPAKRQAITNPKNTINSVKRFMGKKYSDINEEKRNLSYVVEKGSNDTVRVKIGSRKYTPQELSAMILQKMKSTAEDYLGSEVKEAVITVPAYFNDSERQATKEAGTIAGLDVKRIINEPTAAALAYGLDKKDKDLKIAVYDFGGGTFDISILELGDGVFEVKSTNGDVHLGGDDFDSVLIDWLAEEFKKDEGIDLREDPMALQRLKEGAEKAKIELSSSTSTEINLPYIMPVDGVPKHLVKSLSRAKFEQLSQKLIERTLDPCKKALKDAKIDVSEIEKIGTIEKAVHDKNYPEKDLFDLYKRFQFNFNQLLNAQNEYKKLSKIEGRALIYQKILLESEMVEKLKLLKVLKNSFKDDDLDKAFDLELKIFLEKINPVDIPDNLTSFYYTNIQIEKDDDKKIKFNNDIMHQSKLINYFNGDYASSKISKDTNNFLKKIKKNKKYFLSKKDIIFLESLRYDGIEISEKYDDLYQIDENEIPTDIQIMINNSETGLALLRIAEVIGQDEIDRIDEDTIYFIITALNKLNIDWMRNKILLKVLPLKV